MATRGRRKMTEQDSDYDGAWKEVLRQYLRQILEKYLPAIAAEIDWRHPPQWSDKELGRILRQRRRRPKSVDMLVKVRLLNGAEQWILLHMEIQSSREAGCVTEAWFQGGDCLISQAAASILCQAIEGRTVDELRNLTARQVLQWLEIPLTARRMQGGLLAFKVLKTLIYALAPRSGPELR